jgi:hypothetical protein
LRDFAGFAAMFPKLAGPVSAFGKVLLFLGKTALPAVGKAILWVGRAFLMNPIGLAITAIAVAAYLIYRYWDPIKAFFLGLWDEVKAAFSGGIVGIAALIINWSPLGLFYKAFAGVFSWFGIELPAKFTEFGANILRGMIDGIMGQATALKDNISAAIGGGIDAVKEKLGINSPSRVFMEIGGYSMQGLRQGIDAAGAAPIEAMRRMIGGLVSSAALALPAAPALAAPPPLFAQAPAAQSIPASGSPSAGASGTITINVYPAPGMDERALADLVAQKIKDVQRTGDARGRSRLTDAD